jgi:hypothetical protein
MLGRLAVFADQPTQDLPGLDPGGDADDLATGLAARRFLLQGLVASSASRVRPPAVTAGVGW